MADSCNRCALLFAAALMAVTAGGSAITSAQSQTDGRSVSARSVESTLLQADVQAGGEAVSSVAAIRLTTGQLMAQAAIEAAEEPVVMRPGFVVTRAFGRAVWRDASSAASGAPPPAVDELSVPVSVLQNFTGATLGELGSLPPDPSGGAGPTQFLLAANGRIRTFSKATGAADGVLNVTTNAFFISVRNGAAIFTPKVKYDRYAGRWFIIAITDALPGRVVIASSNASTITPATIWSFFSFDNTFTGTNCALDSPTFGLDPYALYVGVLQFCDGGVNYAGTSGFVVRKTSVIDAATPAVTAFHGLAGVVGTPGLFAPQGVDTEDFSGVGYFIGVDNSAFGSLVLRRVSNPGTTPTISGNIGLAVAATAAPIRVPHLGNIGGGNGNIDAGDDRLSAASVRNGSLWTSHTIGVVDSGAASGTANRNAVRWYEIGSLTGTPAVVQSGTLFTAGAPGSFDVRSYFVPSIATSNRGRSVIGFSAAGTSEFINAGVAERFSGDAAGTLRAPQFLTAATAAYNPPGDPGSASRGRRWGGASDTILDGCDGSTIWTVQQFTDTTNSYGLQIGRTVGPGAPTPVSVTPSVVASGVASINLQLTATSSGGSAFFDLGSGYLCRVAAAIPGVIVNSITLTGLTTATINISTVNATPGLKAITIVNPDAQSASSAPILRVTPGPYVVIESPAAGSTGQPVTVRGWAVDGNAPSGTGVDAVHVYAYPAAGNPIFLGAATYGLSRPDIGAAHGTRFTPSGFTITAPNVLPVGPYTIVAYAHSTATGTFNGTAAVAVTLAALAPPFGSVDTPADGVTVAGELPVTGWALDDAGVKSVDIFRDPVAGEPGQLFVGRAIFIRGARPDVQATFPSVPDNDNAGWGFMVLTNMLPSQGNGTFTLHVYATDYAGLVTHLGQRRIVAANTASPKPFGTIDTPGQGETVSGTIVNFGWALAVPGRSIPIDGSTIDVYVDGVFRGHPIYNNVRSDIATLFPGLYNTTGGRGAVGYFMLDTTTLANGLHTIQWSIRDDAGQTSGVGSRFFRVQN